MANRATIHHYVPKLLLRNFSNHKEHVCVYDKHQGRSLVANIKNVAAERNFYDFNLGAVDVSLENDLSKLEAKCQKALDLLLRTESIYSLSKDVRATIACFVALQLIRTRKQREVSEHVEIALREKIKRMHLELPKEMQGDGGAERVAKALSLTALLKFYEFIPHIYNKEWALLKAAGDMKFYISDCPVVLNNEKDFGPYGNLGLALPGIEIYIPLSSTRCLAMYSPTIKKVNIDKIAELSLFSVVAVGLFTEATKEVRRFCDALDGQAPYCCTGDNVTFLNSLQVRFSSQYVFCEDNSFDLVERMLADDPSIKKGLLPTVD